MAPPIIPSRSDSVQPDVALDPFEQQLRVEVEAARTRIRAAPSPLSGLTREDILRARACTLPEIIGVGPRRKPRGTGQG
jgi:hypothetical protein